MLNLDLHYTSVPCLRRTKFAYSRMISLRFALALFIGIVGLYSTPAVAQLTLTPAAMHMGWKLTPFATNFASNPLGIAFTDAGTVLVTDGAGEIRVFPNDMDGQDASKVPIGATYQWSPCGLTRVGSRFFMNKQHQQEVIEINPNGTEKQFIVGNLTHATGIAVNPNNGHLFVSSYDHTWIADVDPVQKKASSFLTLPASYSGADGLCTDGVTLYLEAAENNSLHNGHILGFRLSDKKLVFDSGYLLGADGIAVGVGSLSGSLFVNTNDGQLFQIDLSTQVITLLATGGSRGDFVTVDPNGTLLLTQSGWIARLTAPPGESFETANISILASTVVGGTNTLGTITLAVPVPATLVVALASANKAARVPVSITIPAGSNTGTFTITTTAVSAVTTGQITATLNEIKNGVTLTVKPK